MKHLCIGVNGHFQEIKDLVENISCIGSIYTSDFIKNTTGGRSGGIIRKIEQIREISNYLKTKKIDYYITNNHTVFVYKRMDDKFWPSYKEHILELEEIGVKGIIVGHPFFVDFIKKNTKLDVCISTTAEVATVRAALYYEDYGADMICPSYSINYNIDRLIDIKNNLKHAKIKLLINEFCLGDCIHRRYHQNCYIGETNLDSDYGYTCHKIVLSKPETILQNNAIRPEDLKHYYDVTDIFKISLREPPFYDAKGNIEIVKAYAAECFYGNYMELLTQHLSKMIKIPNKKLDSLFAVKSKCDKNCKVCDECKKIYDEAMEAVKVG